MNFCLKLRTTDLTKSRLPPNIPQSTSNTIITKQNYVKQEDWKRKMLFNDEIMNRIKLILSAEEVDKFLILSKKMHYEEIVEIINKIIKDKCVQLD